MKKIPENLPPFEKLITIIKELRNPDGGCPWDIKQTHQSLADYLLEEALECIDAIHEKPASLAEELGDVLLQVVLHSQIASETKNFDVIDVINKLNHKLIERHPHVFGEVQVGSAEDVAKNWQASKGKSGAGLLSGIPKAAPALEVAHQIGKKSATIGFDWNRPDDIKQAITDEIMEFLNAPDNKNRDEEFGDILFTLAQLARMLKINPELALRATNEKFKARITEMEKSGPLNLKSKEELDDLWQKAKSSLKAKK